MCQFLSFDYTERHSMCCNPTFTKSQQQFQNQREMQAQSNKRVAFFLLIERKRVTTFF